MVHLGEERFYDETYSDALSHDVVLIEGVKSPIVRNLTRTYRWVDLKKLALIKQPQIEQSNRQKPQIILADLSSDEFTSEWLKIPFFVRAALNVAAPLLGLHRKFTATRESLADKMGLDYLRTGDEILEASETSESIEHAILVARDARLIRHLSTELDRPLGEKNRIAVVFGAKHMRAAIRELSQRGFHCADAKWEVIFAV
jgi:hypothetical protein